MKNLLKLAVLAMSVVVLPVAHATDGVIEINQARALAGGITPGDTPGYPVTISLPGSYRLTSNLVQPDANTNVIELNTNNITIDLNGFAITGANQCTWLPGPTISCSHNGTGTGISEGSIVTTATIKNGTITGMGSHCVEVIGQGNHIYDLHVMDCGGDGITANSNFSGSTISHVTAIRSLGSGIRADFADILDSVASHNGGAGFIALYGVVRNSSAYGNISDGIYSLRGTVTGNTALTNGRYGINIGYGSAIGNTVDGNRLEGINLMGPLTYSANMLRDNNSAGVQISGGGNFLLNGGGNVCQNAACP